MCGDNTIYPGVSDDPWGSSEGHPDAKDVCDGEHYSEFRLPRKRRRYGLLILYRTVANDIINYMRYTVFA